jgi:hypothetical protein
MLRGPSYAAGRRSADLVDSGRTSIAWSDSVTLVLTRPEDVDPVSMHDPVSLSGHACSRAVSWP